MTDQQPRHLIVVLVFIRQGDSILLVKQNYGQQYWSLPGGMVELGESLEQAAAREVYEETGLETRVTRVVGLYSKPAENALAVTFEAQVLGGELRPAHEISACRYFPLDNLPALIRPHLRQRVEDFRRGLLHAVWRAQ